jgi:hypothetical protein
MVGSSFGASPRAGGALSSPGSEIPVIPLEPGIFSILPGKSRFGTENGEPNQAVASEFSWPLQSGIHTA